MKDNLIGSITFNGMEDLDRYYSLYKGIVIDTDDPDHVNCIEVAIPGVQYGIPSIWAEPLNQWGGPGYGFKMLSPELGDIVWVMFEQGEPNHPLWTYCGWSPDEVPEELFQPFQMGLITPKGNLFLFDESSGNLRVGIHGNSDIHIEGSSDITVDGTLSYNGGNLGGLIKIKELTNKINELVTQLNELRTLFNTHTHSGVQPGGGTSATPIQQSTKAFSQFHSSDYEDTKIKH